MSWSSWSETCICVYGASHLVHQDRRQICARWRWCWRHKVCARTARPWMPACCCRYTTNWSGRSEMNTSTLQQVLPSPFIVCFKPGFHACLTLLINVINVSSLRHYKGGDGGLRATLRHARGSARGALRRPHLGRHGPLRTKHTTINLQTLFTGTAPARI